MSSNCRRAINNRCWRGASGENRIERESPPLHPCAPCDRHLQPRRGRSRSPARSFAIVFRNHLLRGSAVAITTPPSHGSSSKPPRPLAGETDPWPPSCCWPRQWLPHVVDCPRADVYLAERSPSRRREGHPLPTLRRAGGAAQRPVARPVEPTTCLAGAGDRAARPAAERRRSRANRWSPRRAAPPGRAAARAAARNNPQSSPKNGSEITQKHPAQSEDTSEPDNRTPGRHRRRTTGRTTRRTRRRPRCLRVSADPRRSPIDRLLCSRA